MKTQTRETVMNYILKRIKNKKILKFLLNRRQAKVKAKRKQIKKPAPADTFASLMIAFKVKEGLKRFKLE